MRLKTDTLQKYINIFGENVLISSIRKAKLKKSPENIIEITNPVMRFLVNTTYIKGDRLYTHKELVVPPIDYSYFRAVSALFDDLADEITANPSYKSQIAEKLLHTGSGPMLSAFNEIMVAGYCKSIGLKIFLNSSRDKGKPDIDLVDYPFAIDAKVFPNNRLLLEAIINQSAKNIIDAVKLVRNQGLLISIFEPDKKKFHKSLSNLADAFKDTSIGKYSDDTISALIMDNSYAGADFHVTVHPQKVNVFFQACWDMAPAIEDAKASINTAIKQAKTLGKQAIPWIMVPRDAGRNGIEVQTLRFIAKFHEYVTNNEAIYIMPVYSFEFEANKFTSIFDVFQMGNNILGINDSTFQKFIRNLMSRQEMYI